MILDSSTSPDKRKGPFASPPPPSSSRLHHQNEHERPIMNRRNGDFFSFSFWDVWADYCSKKRYMQRCRTRKTTTILLWLLIAAMGYLQLHMMYQATAIHNTKSNENKDTILMGKAETGHQPGSVMITTTTSEHPSRVSQYRKSFSPPPKLLLGIMGNANNHMGKIYRNRHRKLFQLWNDSRLCTIEQYDSYYNRDEVEEHDCRVVYAFIVGGYNSSMIDQPTFRYEEPLTMKAMSQGNKMPRYKDIANNSDVVILNIRENMNEGKTPTYLAWAYQQSVKYNIPYIAKCDSDAIFRWNSLLQFVYKELPSTTNNEISTESTTTPSTETPQGTSILAGAWRHKAYWNVSNMHDNTFWNEEYYGGLHMYLAGQLYIFSADLISGLVEEAKQQPQNHLHPEGVNIPDNRNYWEGHEDHDATAMIEVAPSNKHKIIRWLNMPKHYRFWEHPVKGEYWWKRILQRETKKARKQHEHVLANGTTFTTVGNRWEIPENLLVQQRRRQQQQQQWTTSAESPTPRSLLVILGASDKAKREQYRMRLIQQNSSLGQICMLKEITSSSKNCRLYYVFAVGGNPTGSTEYVLENQGSSVIIPFPSSEGEDDVMFLNIRDNIHEGIGQTILYAINRTISKDTIDGMLLICQANYLIHATQWFQIETSIFAGGRDTSNSGSSSPHSAQSIVLGDLRDKQQIPREFAAKNESYWYWEFENIHMYLGSEVLGFSMSLVSGMLEQARVGIKGGTVPVITSGGGDEQSRQKRNSYPRRWLEGNLGHDLSVFAYYVGAKTVLHWIPIRKSQRFWNRLL